MWGCDNVLKKFDNDMQAQFSKFAQDMRSIRALVTTNNEELQSKILPRDPVYLIDQENELNDLVRFLGGCSESTKPPTVIPVKQSNCSHIGLEEEVSLLIENFTETINQMKIAHKNEIDRLALSTSQKIKEIHDLLTEQRVEINELKSRLAESQASSFATEPTDSGRSSLPVFSSVSPRSTRSPRYRRRRQWSQTDASSSDQGYSSASLKLSQSSTTSCNSSNSGAKSYANSVKHKIPLKSTSQPYKKTPNYNFSQKLDPKFSQNPSNANSSSISYENNPKPFQRRFIPVQPRPQRLNKKNSGYNYSQRGFNSKNEDSDAGEDRDMTLKVMTMGMSAAKSEVNRLPQGKKAAPTRYRHPRQRPTGQTWVPIGKPDRLSWTGQAGERAFLVGYPQSNGFRGLVSIVDKLGDHTFLVSKSGMDRGFLCHDSVLRPYYTPKGKSC